VVHADTRWETFSRAEALRSASPRRVAMAPRPIASATISFGLVSVPVNLYSSAETRESVSFQLLSKKSGARLKQQYIDPTTSEVVPRTEMVKGYETAKDQYVIFSPEELK